MKITIIYGSNHKCNTYHAVGLVKNELLKHSDVEFKEYFLPKDLPEFCTGCYSCFFKGEENCPHAKYVQPIVKDMLESDGLIFSSPVYVLAESGEMKAFLDHMAYMFIPHRPQKEMFTKKAIIISTTAGAGTGKCIKAISSSLKYWGINKIYKCGITMFALSWDEMSAKKKSKYEIRLSNIAKQFYNDIFFHKKHLPYIVQRFSFFLMKKLIYNDKSEFRKADHSHWESNGWFDGKSPFKQQ